MWTLHLPGVRVLRFVRWVSSVLKEGIAVEKTLVRMDEVARRAVARMGEN